METTIVYWGYTDNGKENGNYYSILVLYRGLAETLLYTGASAAALWTWGLKGKRP